jgi:hypothetical protein
MFQVVIPPLAIFRPYILCISALPVFLINPDMEKVREEAMASQSDGSGDGRFRISIPTIDANEYIEFGDSKYLASSIYTAQTGVNSEALTAIDADKGAGSSGGMRVGGGPSGGGFGGIRIREGTNPDGSTVKPLSELDVSLDLKIILMIIGIALALATIASLISIVRITKYEPINILMERN